MKFKVSENPNVLNKTKYIKKKKQIGMKNLKVHLGGIIEGFLFGIKIYENQNFNKNFFHFLKKI